MTKDTAFEMAIAAASRDEAAPRLEVSGGRPVYWLGFAGNSIKGDTKVVIGTRWLV
jgi:hypothetical protein